MFFLILIRRPLISTLFPYTTLFRSSNYEKNLPVFQVFGSYALNGHDPDFSTAIDKGWTTDHPMFTVGAKISLSIDRKSTRLNSSHGSISYAVFCLKKKKISETDTYI